MTQFCYIGCRTSRMRGARGKGIEVYQLDTSTGWQHIQTIQPVQENPSWLTLNRAGTRLYVVHGDGNLVCVYERNPDTGFLNYLSQQTTGPANSNPELDPNRRNNPVHAACDPSGNYLLIANHEAGNVAVLPIVSEGHLAEPISYTVIPGRPSDEHDFPGLSRPHEIIFDAKGTHFALPIQGRKAGNGIDMVRIYAFQQGQCRLADEAILPAGCWPRHVDFHPQQHSLYAVSELGSSITVFDYDNETGNLMLKQTLSSLPEGYAERSDASEIEVHPSGKFLYAANRGHDSIGIFSIDQESGMISALDWVPCGGKTPRFTCITPDGRYFYSANEDSDAIQIFDISLSTGMLTATENSIITPSPTCICFSD